MTYSPVTKIYGKLSQKREMLSDKASSLVTAAWENFIKLRINAGEKNDGNKRDKVIADAYGNKFIIPLDFEMLDSAAPNYQAGLGNRLCLKLLSTITTELPNPQYHHQKFQMLSIRSQIYP